MRFSIVITSYNQRAFIGAAVDSALAQSHTAQEVIVVDDGSVDGSVEVLEEYGHEIRLVKFAGNRGAIAARNRGAAEAEGEYLVFLDGDDMLMPWALGVYEQIVANRRPKVIFGETSWFRDASDLQKLDAPCKIDFVEYGGYILRDRPIGLSASSIVVDRLTFLDAGGWTPGIFHLDCQDLSTKLGTAGPTILVTSPPVTRYRIHSANSIHNVAPFLCTAHRLIGKERAGEYPGGQEHRFERYASFGGLLIFWFKRAIKAGLYTDAFKLAASGWSMIAAAVLRRSVLAIRKRYRVETIELSATRRVAPPQGAVIAVPK